MAYRYLGKSEDKLIYAQEQQKSLLLQKMVSVLLFSYVANSKQADKLHHDFPTIDPVICILYYINSHEIHGVSLTCSCIFTSANPTSANWRESSEGNMV